MRLCGISYVPADSTIVRALWTYLDDDGRVQCVSGDYDQARPMDLQFFSLMGVPYGGEAATEQASPTG